MKRRPFGKFGVKKRALYLGALREGGRRGASARAVGVSAELVRLYRRRNKRFAALEQEAEIEANEQVEDALYQAAVSGNVVACQVWLYNREPERWRDRRYEQRDVRVSAEVSVRHGSPLPILVDQEWFSAEGAGAAEPPVADPAER